MNKLVPIKDSEFAQPDWIDNLGDYNRLPEPFRRCQAQEFYGAFHQGLTHLEYRQLYLDDGITLYSTQIFWFHDTAYAISTSSKEEPQFFRIGCIHQWGELSQERCQELHVPHHGKCYHVYECSSCATLKTEDSSD